MGRMIDDDIKQQLLDALAKEPPIVVSTAYVYAKNYVNYGEDIAKAWTTAVQQSSILQKARQQAWAEAYDSFKKDYESRLKADMVSMLEELQAEMESLRFGQPPRKYVVDECLDVIQQKIDSLKGEQA